MSDSESTPANIYPALSYDDASVAIEWLCHAFGFIRRLVVPGPGGSIVHSELSLGSGVILPTPRRRPDQSFAGVEIIWSDSKECLEFGLSPP